MPDQADELRRLVARDGRQSDAMPRVGIPPLTDDLITYRRLWLDLKGALTDEASRGACPPLYDGHNSDAVLDEAVSARRFLDRMEQAETLAFYVHVPQATPETFASVRAEMGGKSHG